MDGGNAGNPNLPPPPLCAHLAMELRHAAAALHVEPHCVPHALILAVIVARPAWGWGAGGPGVGLSVSLLPAPPPVPLRTVGVRTPICHGQGEGSRMALSLPSAAQYPPSWLCASQHSPACSNVAQCSPRTDQQPSNLTPAWPSASRSIPALPVRSQSGTSDPPPVRSHLGPVLPSAELAQPGHLSAHTDTSPQLPVHPMLPVLPRLHVQRRSLRDTWAWPPRGRGPEAAESPGPSANGRAAGRYL